MDDQECNDCGEMCNPANGEEAACGAWCCFERCIDGHQACCDEPECEADREQ